MKHGFHDVEQLGFVGDHSAHPKIERFAVSNILQSDRPAIGVATDATDSKGMKFAPRCTVKRCSQDDALGLATSLSNNDRRRRLAPFFIRRIF